MRLLNTHTLKLQEFIGDTTPNYAILSHTWEREEVSLQDFLKVESRQLAGFLKIARCCQLAAADGWEYIWIDTCCIDKSSSAELSEAINSMYQWYEEAQVCYVYMADVDVMNPWFKKFTKSRWFSRGWTLQELLAPRSVLFYDQNFIELGSKVSLENEICRATGINIYNLYNPRSASVAARMSWAALRKTTRIEDIAYCLLGLFDVNMPLLYGENEKAFKRLQYEIIRVSNDESIFAWRNDYLSFSGMFAESPLDFAESGNIINIKLPDVRSTPYTMTNIGLAFEMPMRYIYNRPGQSGDWGCPPCIAPLACATSSDPETPLAISLEDWMGQGVVRTNPTKLQPFKNLKQPDIRSSSSRTYYVRELSISKRAKHITDGKDLPVKLRMAPEAIRYFPHVFAINKATPVKQYVDRDGTVDLEGNFEPDEWKIVKFYGPTDDNNVKPNSPYRHRFDLYLMRREGAREDDGLIFRVLVKETIRELLIHKSQQGKGNAQHEVRKLGDGEFLWVALKKGSPFLRLGSYRIGPHWNIEIDVNSFDRSEVLR